MKIPMEKYLGNPNPYYKLLIDNLLSMLWGSKFTPSELREACDLAVTIYEKDQRLKKNLDKP